MLSKFPSMFRTFWAGFGNNEIEFTSFSFIATDPHGFDASSIHSCSVLYVPSPAVPTSIQPWTGSQFQVGPT